MRVRISVRAGLRLPLLLTAAGIAISGLAYAGSCDTFRLDQQADNPLNPYKGVAAMSDAEKKDFCAKKPSYVKDDCVKGTQYPGVDPFEFTDEGRKKVADAKNPNFVAVRDQGADGNCFAQVTAGLINYRRAVKGQKPNVMPEYLSSADCHYTLPPPGSDPAAAAELYNNLAACDLSPFMNTNWSSTGAFMKVLGDSFDKFKQTGDVCNAVDYVDSEIKKASDASGATGILAPGKPLEINPQFNKDLDAAIQSAFSKAVDDPKLTDGHPTEEYARVAWRTSLTGSIDPGSPLVTPKPTPVTAAWQKKEDEAKSNLDDQVKGVQRCVIERAVFSEYCANHKDSAPKDAIHLKENNIDDMIPREKYNPCVNKWAKDTYEVDHPHATKAEVDDFMAGKTSYIVSVGGKPTALDVTKLIKSAADDDRIQCLNQMRPAMRAKLLENSIGQVRDKKEPVMVSVGAVTALMNKATGGSKSGQSRADASHIMMLIGQSKNGNKCGYWLRNSWGAGCPKSDDTGNNIATADYQCDATTGNIWISSDLLKTGDGVFNTYTDKP